MYRVDCWGWHRRFTLIVVVMALFVFPLVVEQAFAHKVTIFAWVEGDTVHTESKFSGGRVAKQAPIEVYDWAGALLLEGRTDDEGRFAFKTPKQEELRIVLVAGAGHRNEWVVKAEEFAGHARPAADDDTVLPKQTEPVGAAHLPGRIDVSREDLQTMIEAALEKQLEPVLRRLHQMDEEPRLADIVGGIGYILGLVGLGAYIHYRRRSSSEGPRAR
jgi:nickel transport protein